MDIPAFQRGRHRTPLDISKRVAQEGDPSSEAHRATIAQRGLRFLARDIVSHPERLQAVDAGLVGSIQSLVGQTDVDLDAPLSANDE